MYKVVLYDCSSAWVTQVINDVQVKDSDMTVYGAASRAISVALGWRQAEDWDKLRFLYDAQSKALSRHVTVHSWLTETVVFVPVPGVQLTHEAFEIVDEEILRERFTKAVEFNILQAGLNSQHLEVPSMIYKDAKYGLIALEDYEPYIYFNEAHYCGYFTKPRESWAFYNIPQLPTDEALEQLEGLVITGAKYAAYDMEVPWMATFHALIKRIIEHYPRIKILGICLGCQVAASALGGATIKDPKVSFIYKLESITTTDAVASELPDLPKQLREAEVHEDCVSVLPPGASLYASSESCGVELWGIPGRLLASQFHPEFSNYFNLYFFTDIMVSSGSISAEQGEVAREDFLTPSTSTIVIDVMRSWLHKVPS
jgi:GMP synthase-like glutamine amidotransferase